MDGIEGGQVQGGEPTGNDAPGPNPAWNDVLSVIPQELHQQVTPHFQRWDQAAQQRVEQANSQLEAFQAYQPFLEHGIDPDELRNGLQLLYQINNDPGSVYNALGQAYGLANGAGNPGVNDGTGEGADGQEYQDPRVAELQQNLELVSQIILNDQQAKQAQQADQQLDAELNSLKQKFGDYDEGYVLAMMQNGMSGEDAVQAFQSFRNNLLQSNPRPFAPNVMGGSQGGAGYPSQQIDPAKMSRQEARQAAIQMLQAAAIQQQ